MFKIVFSINNRKIPYYQSEPADAELRIYYTLYPGIIDLITDSGSISMNWGWVPVFDFCVCLNEIYIQLINEYKDLAKFEFTESADNLIFNTLDNRTKIKISASFTQTELIVQTDDFKAELTKMFNDILQILDSDLPQLENKTIYLNLIEKYKLKFSS